MNSCKSSNADVQSRTCGKPRRHLTSQRRHVLDSRVWLALAPWLLDGWPRLGSVRDCDAGPARPARGCPPACELRSGNGSLQRGPPRIELSRWFEIRRRRGYAAGDDWWVPFCCPLFYSRVSDAAPVTRQDGLPSRLLTRKRLDASAVSHGLARGADEDAAGVRRQGRRRIPLHGTMHRGDSEVDAS